MKVINKESKSKLNTFSALSRHQEDKNDSGQPVHRETKSREEYHGQEAQQRKGEG